jgi:hypothetical protein
MMKDPDPANDGVPRLATYFTVYPDPIALTPANPVLLPFSGVLEGFDSVATPLHYLNATPVTYLDDRFARSPFVSVRFHRGLRRYSASGDALSHLTQVIPRVEPYLGIDPTDIPEAVEGDPYAAYTVAELVSPLTEVRDGKWVPADIPALSKNTLSRSLHALMKVVSAYRLVERDTVSIPAPSIERIGPLIFCATRPADPAFGGWDSKGGLVVNPAAIPGQPVSPPDARPDAVDQMLHALAEDEVDGSLNALFEIQADADIALFQRGDFRSAAMLLHTASEVALDLVLAALCWEEGMRPSEAAALFARPLVDRVRGQYHDRLGGGWWTEDQGSPVRKWHRDCVLLRHRVAHTGVRPSRSQIEASKSALAGLSRHLGVRLAESVGRYPRAFSLLVNARWLADQQLGTRRRETALAMADVAVTREFAVWRDALLTERLA